MIAEKVQKRVNALKPLELFSYSDFSDFEKDKQAVAKALSNLFKKGLIRRLSKGIYYKPEFSRFGELSPTDSAIIKKIIESSKKNIAYVSGTNVYRQMGLTTQLSREYVIMNDTRRGISEIQNIRIRFIKSPVVESVEDIRYLQLLDAITDIKNISACSPNEACKVILLKLKFMNQKERKLLVKLASYYRPMTRALLGAFVDILGEKKLSAFLKQSLNPLTTFHVGISDKILPNKAKWFIV